MRINKVVLNFLAIAAVFVLIGSSLANLVRSKEPFASTTTKASINNLDGYYSQKIKWQSCYGNFKCAMFQVPIDYLNPTMGKFDIAVMEHLAANPIGNLVINPGGPGGSGVDYAYSYESSFSTAVIDKFNLIGFDPRGVGRSAPIKCLSSAETDKFYAEDTYPGNSADKAKIQAENKSFAQSCQKKNRYLKYYSTANAARDMDILRALLGDQKLNFFGKSYGTFLGTLYAQLFPNYVGKFVLDGAVDPTMSAIDQSVQQSIGFDTAFKDFASDCIALGDCVFTEDPIKQMLKKLDEIRKDPISVGDRKLTESLSMYGIAYGLYDRESGWPELHTALKDLFSGDGKSLLQMSDVYTGRDSSGNYPTNEAESMVVIGCNDFKAPKNSAETAPLKDSLFGRYIGYSDSVCDYLPHENFVTVSSEIVLAAPTLVIGTTKDPATPYKWAEKLASILRNSKLVTLNAEGHTGYDRGSICVDQLVEKYLISGEIPAQNPVCSA